MAKGPPPLNQRQARRAEAKRAAAQYTKQRLFIRVGLVAVALVLAGLAGWWLIGRSGLSSSSALYQFHTQDIHSLAFDPTSADTIFFGHHQGLLVSHDAGKSWLCQRELSTGATLPVMTSFSSVLMLARPGTNSQPICLILISTLCLCHGRRKAVCQWRWWDNLGAMHPAT
jgi:hypothetical protein